jgi:hypothetical protein
MSVTAGGPPDGGDDDQDIPLSRVDLSLLESTLANIYNTEERSRYFLRQIRFPRELLPMWRDGETSAQYWRRIFEELDRGVVSQPYRLLLTTALRTYTSHRALTALQRRYLDEEQSAARPSAAAAGPGEPSQPGHRQPPGQASPEACHIVAWVNAEERIALEAWLAERGLDPQPEWISATSVSFRVNQADPRIVDRVMSARNDLNWTVVRPGVPDYVLRSMSVQGPDGRSFRFHDVPSATPVSSVASELVEQYTDGLPGSDQPTVIDHVGPDGLRRMNPASTLAEEGINEGERFRVGFERATGPLWASRPSPGGSRTVAGVFTKGVFISYRRADAGAYARLLQLQLRDRLPGAKVFMDLDSIEPGLDFADVIRDAVDSSAVLLTLIGPQWATMTGDDGSRRLDDPDDFVRFEVKTALERERDVRVIPVLVDGARALRQEQLPGDLHRLARLNPFPLSHGHHYEYDAGRLVELIERVLEAAR